MRVQEPVVALDLHRAALIGSQDFYGGRIQCGWCSGVRQQALLAVGQARREHGGTLVAFCSFQCSEDFGSHGRRPPPPPPPPPRGGGGAGGSRAGPTPPL